MNIIFKFFARFYNRFFSEDKSFAKRLRGLVGFTPSNIAIFKLAFYHKSASPEKLYTIQSNERLEYLGDAVLGTIVAEYLFKKYPNSDEGFLTKMRSKIVKRQSLNKIADKMGLDVFLNQYNNTRLSRSMLGNALEALIGAVYLECGYRKTRNYVIHRILRSYLNIHELEEFDDNYKSQLLEWCQKNGQTVAYKMLAKYKFEKRDRFKVAVLIDGKKLAVADDFNKKSAEQIASERAMQVLGLLKKTDGSERTKSQPRTTNSTGRQSSRRSGQDQQSRSKNSRSNSGNKSGSRTSGRKSTEKKPLSPRQQTQKQQSQKQQSQKQQSQKQQSQKQQTKKSSPSKPTPAKSAPKTTAPKAKSPGPKQHHVKPLAKPPVRQNEDAAAKKVLKDLEKGLEKDWTTKDSPAPIAANKNSNKSKTPSRKSTGSAQGNKEQKKPDNKAGEKNKPVQKQQASTRKKQDDQRKEMPKNEGGRSQNSKSSSQRKTHPPRKQEQKKVEKPPQSDPEEIEEIFFKSDVVNKKDIPEG